MRRPYRVHVTTMTIPAVLSAQLATDPEQPLVTFYDDSTGERVELSGTSFANWVAKTANLVRDGLGAQPDHRLALALPTHWLGPVWLCATWACGLEVVLDPARNQPGGYDYAVTGPADLGPLAELASEQTVALSLRPLGGRFTEPLPAGVLDYAAEVPSYGDFFGDSLADPASPALLAGDLACDQAALVEKALATAADVGLEPGSRLLTDHNPASRGGLFLAWLAPLVAGGSVVLVRNPDPAVLAARSQQEHVTATVLTN
jgi:uncharacterized protein (TIGR03089 family)